MSLALPFTIVGAATLLSRLTGFVRDILIAAILGTSAIADIYVAAFLIPNLVRRMMSEGALNAAIVPRLARLEQEGGQQASRGYSDDLLSLLCVVAIVLVLLAEIFMPAIMGLIAHGFRLDPEKSANAVLFGRIAFPFVGFTLVVALLSSLLNAVERYAIAALVPVILNLALIGVMLTLLLTMRFTQYQAGLVLVWTVLAAGAIQLAALWYAAGRVGFDVTPRLWDAICGRIDPSTKTLLMLALPGMVIAGSAHVQMIVASQFASVEPRGMALLYFADRLFQLPLGFVASAIGIVLLPRVSRAMQQGDAEGIVSAQNESLSFAALLILPAFVALFLLSEPIVAVLFQRAAFTADDSAATAANLRMLALALPALVLVKVILPTFLAQERLSVPLLAVSVALSANIASVTLLSSTYPTHAAAMGVAVGAWVNALFLVVAVSRHFTLRRETMARLLGAGVAALIMGLVVGILGEWAADWLRPEIPFIRKGGALFFLCCVGGALYLWLARVFGAINADNLTLLRLPSHRRR